VDFTPFRAKEPIHLTPRMVRDMICVPAKNGELCGLRDAMKFMMLAKARGLNPWEGDCFLIGYVVEGVAQFSLITAHQGFLKRAETHPEYDGMESGVIVQQKSDSAIVDRVGDFRFDDDVLLGAWATVYFKNRSHPMQKRLRLATYTTGRSRWGKDPEGMIVKCVEADSLRSSFPTLLGGMYLEDELSSVVDEVAPGEEEQARRARRASLPAPGGPSEFEAAMAAAGSAGDPVAVPAARGGKNGEGGQKSEASTQLADLCDQLQALYEAGDQTGIRALRDRECGPDGTLAEADLREFDKRCAMARTAISASAEREPGEEG
jgi:phage recombination protein Bet